MGMQRGQLSLQIILPLFGAASIIISSFAVLHQMRASGTSAAFSKLVARETAKSAFVLMESALKRRLWEMPPDNDCLKATSFSAKGTTPDGASYRVDSTYDSSTQTLRMVSKASFKGASAGFEKKAKILDASDFLIFSKSTQTTTLDRHYDGRSALGFIGGKRKVYFEGPVQFSGNLDRPDYATGWNSPSPMVLPSELGTILQGERLYFLKGMKYLRKGGQISDFFPNATYPIPQAMLAPYGARTYQMGAGTVFFTSDFALATQLAQDVMDNSLVGLPAVATLKKSIYPIALFCGNLPLDPETGADNGCYMNDPDQWIVIYYSYGGAANFGLRGDFTCLGHASVPEPGTPKSCSSSEDFPVGFNQWRKDAGLENILYGSDGTPLDFGSINWDNMEALKEDAAACGIVVDPAALPAYQDCDLSNGRVVSDYINGINSCETISRLSLDGITASLPNFDLAAYSDPTQKDRFLRRVIYSKTPTELSQTMNKGLIPALLDPVARNNLSLWMVSEDRFILKPLQPDLTRPVDVNPGIRRKLYFNQAPAGTPDALNPLNLVFLTPEQLQIISPQHVPYLSFEMELALPVVDGKIKPKNHILTDSFHEESSGFKYGFRDIHLGNLTLITNPPPAASTNAAGIYLRGLWAGGLDSSAGQGVRNACMFSDPVTHTSVDPWTAYSPAYPSTGGFPWIPPALPAAPDSVVPPLGSQFYDQANNTVGRFFYPHVFSVQQGAMGGYAMESRVFHEGIKILTKFNASTPAGKRNLASPQYRPQDGYMADLTDRSYTWSHAGYYPATPGTVCTPPAMLNSGTLDLGATMIYLNLGRSLHLHAPPPPSVTGLGSIFGVVLPMVETGL